MRLSALLTGLLFFACVSCKEAGPERFRLSGEAKHEGQPIPYGDVVFTPDGANSGAQGFANIRDGRFDTSASGGKGISGGPTVIRVTGFSKEGGKLLCEYEFKADLPKSDSTYNIEGPPKGTPALPKGPGKTNPEI